MASDYRDRTVEFFRCVDSYKSRISAGLERPKPKSFKSKMLTAECWDDFVFKCGHLKADFDSTGQKMKKLKLLISMKAKEPSIPKSFSSLVDVIQTDLKDLTSNLKSVQRLYQSAQANFSSRKQLTMHFTLVIKIMQSFLRNITGQLKTSIEENRELIMQPEDTFSPPSVFMPAVTVLPGPQQPPHHPQAQFSYPVTTHASLLDFRPSQNLPNPPQACPQMNIPLYEEINTTRQRTFVSDNSPMLMQAREEQQMFIPHVDQEIRQRDSAMNKVEQTILQLGEMYQQFATLVHEQGETVTRIDMHMDETLCNVDSANVQLMNFLKNISKRRQLIIKTFVCLLVIFTVYAFVKR